MNNFENIKSKNLDELVDWLDKYRTYEDSFWIKWWDKNYCNKCEPVIKNELEKYWNEYAWCELNGKCRYFQELDRIPSSKQVIKMWLETECV